MWRACGFSEVIQMRKKILKLWRDPKSFLADAGPVRKIFTALYSEQLLQMAQSSFAPARTVSRLEPCVLYEGAVIASSREVARDIQSVVEALSTKIPVVLFSSSRPNTVHIGVSRGQFHRLYQLLTDERYVEWDLEPRHVVRNTLPRLSEIAMANQITASVEVIKGVYAHFRISLYHLLSDGKTKAFFTNDDSNIFARKINHKTGNELFGSAGLKLYDVTVGSQPIQHVRFPIDVVYTWVNNEDPEWQASYQEHAPVAKRVSDALALSRFKSRNELMYSIRSVFQYMPWVRKIHVLTNCRPPSWFLKDRGVNWIRHEDVFDKTVLPTFSSHAIETNLHHIPDLAENFLYFNDDFFVNQPVSPSLFFEISGLSKSRFEPYGVVNGAFLASDPDYLNAARLGAELLARKYGVWPGQLHEHTPYALRVSVLNEMERVFSEQFLTTRENRFRGEGDISVVSFLYHHYATLNGAAVPANYPTKLIKNSAPNLARILSTLNEKVGPATFCLNDGNDSHEDGVWDFEIRRFMEERFPHASPCESAEK